MVKLEQNKIVIEIETNDPYEDLTQCQLSILELIANLSYENPHLIDQNLWRLTWLLKSMVLDCDNIETILNDKFSKRKILEAINEKPKRVKTESLEAGSN